MTWGRGFLTAWIFVLFSLSLMMGGVAEADSSPSLFYRFFKYRYYDVDQILQKYLKIEFKSCEYLSQVESKITVYDGIGPCIYLMFVENLGTPNRAGVIRAKAHLMGTHLETWVHIFADPVPSNDSLIENVFRLIQERWTPWNVKNFDDAFWGTWVVYFPNADGLNLISHAGIRSVLESQKKDLQAISISFFPVREKADPAFHQGMVYFFSPHSSIRSTHVKDPLYQLYFKTDLLIRKEHRFLEVEGQ